MGLGLDRSRSRSVVSAGLQEKELSSELGVDQGRGTWGLFMLGYLTRGTAIDYVVITGIAKSERN